MFGLGKEAMIFSGGCKTYGFAGVLIWAGNGNTWTGEFAALEGRKQGRGSMSIPVVKVGGMSKDDDPTPVGIVLGAAGAGLTCTATLVPVKSPMVASVQSTTSRVFLYIYGVLNVLLILLSVKVIVTRVKAGKAMSYSVAVCALEGIAAAGLRCFKDFNGPWNFYPAFGLATINWLKYFDIFVSLSATVLVVGAWVKILFRCPGIGSKISVAVFSLISIGLLVIGAVGAGNFSGALADVGIVDGFLDLANLGGASKKSDDAWDLNRITATWANSIIVVFYLISMLFALGKLQSAAKGGSTYIAKELKRMTVSVLFQSVFLCGVVAFLVMDYPDNWYKAVTTIDEKYFTIMWHAGDIGALGAGYAQIVAFNTSSSS